MSRTLTTNGRTYELDIRDVNLMQDAHAQTIWIVRISDETDYEVTSARIATNAGTCSDVHESAREWLNALCRRNPGKLLKYSIRLAMD